MKVAQAMIRRWTLHASRRAIPLSRASMGIVPNGTLSFCTGPSPDIPLTHNNHSSARSFSSKSTLVDILAREEQEEVDTGNTEMPSELSDLKQSIQEKWKIVEDGATTNLFKIDNPSGNKIQLSFHCQDTVEEVGDEEESLEEDAGEEEESPLVRFTVTVAKAGKSLNFACFSEYGQVNIEGVSTTTDSTVEHIHENQGTLPKVEYQGPDFTELAEDLQEALAVYLEEECGVDSDVATFVAMFSDYREEMNYVDFLKQAQAIVS